MITLQFIAIISPPASLFEDNWSHRYQTIRVWVQVTQIGLDAFSDHTELLAWTTSLQDGEPLSGVTGSFSLVRLGGS